MTIKELKAELDKFPEDYEIIFHEKGSVHDTKINRVYEHNYDKAQKKKKITLTN